MSPSQTPSPSAAFAWSLVASASIATVAGLAAAQELPLVGAVAGLVTAPDQPPQRLAAAPLGSQKAANAAPTPHANTDHPAVIVWQRAQAGKVALDTDHFIVLPPASSRWASNAAP